MTNSASFFERGNAALELVLFAPVALFFLTAVIDGGLFLTDSAAAIDTIRTSARQQAAFSTARLGATDNEAEEQAFLANVKQNIADSFRLTAKDHETEAEVCTALIRLTFDAFSGAFQGVQARLVEPQTSCSHATSMPEIVSNLARSASAQIPSPHAAISAYIYDPLNQLPPTESFAPQATYLYVHTKLKPRGLHGGAVQALLGKRYELNEEGLFPLRMLTQG